MPQPSFRPNGVDADRSRVCSLVKSRLAQKPHVNCEATASRGPLGPQAGAEGHLGLHLANYTGVFLGGTAALAGGKVLFDHGV
jgi:hypothetical protein